MSPSGGWRGTSAGPSGCGVGGGWRGDGDVIHVDAAFGEQFLNIAVRQREAQVPAHGKDDYVRREADQRRQIVR